MSLPPAQAPAQDPLTRTLRRLLMVLLVAGPVLVALKDGFKPGVLWGAPTSGVLARVHAWWYAAQDVAPIVGFSGVAGPVAAGPLPDPVGRIAGPLVEVLGASAALFGVLSLHLLVLLIVSARATRGAGPTWGPVAAGVFCASPAVLSLLAEGDPEALAGWTVLLVPLCPGVWVVPAAMFGAALAPGLVPVAILHGAVVAWGDADPARRRWLGGAAGAAVVIGLMLGGPGTDLPNVMAWFQVVPTGPEPERFPTFVGVIPVLLLLGGLSVPGARRLVLGAGLALLIAGVRSPLPGERFLVLVPLYAALVGALLARRWAPRHEVAASLLCGAMLLGEGWMGSVVPVPTSTLGAPAPMAALPGGPVLDLPGSRTASKRSLYLQTLHGQPISADPTGRLDPAVQELVNTLASGGCPDVRAAGFTSVMARREQAFLQLGPLTECLGPPTADDGKVAVWALSPTQR